MIDRVAASPDGELDPSALDTLARAAEVAARMKSGVDLWLAQNATWRLLDHMPELRQRAANGDRVAVQSIADLERLARALKLAVRA